MHGKSNKNWSCLLRESDGGVEWKGGSLPFKGYCGLGLRFCQLQVLTLSKLQNLFVCLLNCGLDGGNTQFAGLLK